MITIKADELIHSYLVRVMNIAGEIQQSMDFSGIISESGVIRELPAVKKSKRQLFSQLTSKEIECILIQNTPFIGTGTLEFMRAYIFNGKESSNKNLYARTQLRYCVECFKEQIKSDGHTWFRLNWAYSVDCYIHNKRMCCLHTIIQRCCGASVNIFNSLRSATTGRCFNCQSSNWEFANRVNLGERNKSNYLLLKFE